MKVYTRSGDDGHTGLVGGKRVLKSSLRIDLYGELDHLNAHIGLIVSMMDNISDELEQKIFLIKVQSVLFDLGSLLACEPIDWKKYKLPSLPEGLVKALEKEIDNMDKVLTPLSHFILPGGGLLSSQLHIARTLCRGVERRMVSFSLLKEDTIPENGLIFLNRFSDYLFVAARYFNFLSKVDDIEWRSGSTSFS